MNGFLLINKPEGITSHDVIYQIRKQLKIKKVGHTGTLDPFATGLLIVCLGDACKLSDEFLNFDKKYEGTLIFNKNYDTLDVTGKLLDEKDVNISLNELNIVVNDLKKQEIQYPPMYAAIKVGGKKLYEYARANIEIKVEPRKIKIYEFDITKQITNDEFTFTSYVSKGTYLRAIARDLGEKLNTYGALKTLNRTAIGNFTLNNSIKIQDINIEKDLITLNEYLSSKESIVLDDYLIKLVQNGVILDERQIKTDKSFVVKNKNDKIVAYYGVVDKYQYKPILILKD